MSQQRVFGRRKHSHTIIFASGEKVRHVTVRPWVAGLALSFLGMAAFGYLAATSYLVLRDDLIGAAMARQARMQHAYEDRIAALRSQVDRVTSRQLIDQQLMEDKVAELMLRQEALTSRHGQISPLLDRVSGASGLKGPVPVPTRRPERRAEAADRTAPTARLAAVTVVPDPAAPINMASSSRMAYAQPLDSVADRADRIFSKVSLSLKSIERDQVERIQTLAASAYETAFKINSMVESLGLPGADVADTAVGGPYIGAGAETNFDETLEGLDAALSQLEAVRRSALMAPISLPAPGAAITSRYGKRQDPFLKRMALHSGVDFRVRTGTPILATGAGTVIRAGRSGGYGKLVEIDHGNGLTSRYAHLSRILVSPGQRVSTGDTIGKSGSTGRSTGPHLHYEIRRNGRALDPSRFLSVAKKLRPLLSDG
ncbi:peptidoglycan DD-metalloendopeptidase family protein [Pseudohoeflea coraliihabitans]|uniref:M23 family metallopeptidase n=1 Tax=Pseudohoeflea coraliihabitans TaxID=2860393 RepID=A0ABS6WSD0_9HYPH|nr:M23 family metallopeptidase [Pseudohoeflea sp. DP4N28-3]